jgi:hypothetical protein
LLCLKVVYFCRRHKQKNFMKIWSRINLLFKRISESGFFWKNLQLEMPLFLYSFFCLLLSIILVQFAWVLLTSALLVFYHIPFTWHPLLIADISKSWQYWSESKLFLIYSIVPFALLLAGLFIHRQLNKNRSFSYKEKVLLNWLSFVLINMFPGGIIAGVFIYDGLGVLINFMFQSLWFRLFLALIPLLIFVSTYKIWAKLFLKAAPSSHWINRNKMKFRYLQLTYILPLFFVTVLLVLNSYWQKKWYLGLIFGSFFFLIVPLLGKGWKSIKVLLHKTTESTPRLGTLLFLIALLILIFISSPFISVPFR